MSEYKDQAECDYNEVLEQKRRRKELFSEQEILEGQKKLEACCVDVKLPAPSWTTIFKLYLHIKRMFNYSVVDVGML